MLKEYSQERLTSRFEEALVYASRLHARQTRKASGTPYVAHLLGVAALVIEDGGDEDEAIAALLHDAIEDQGGDTARQEIRRRFGETVTSIVDGCTDAETIPKPAWRERKERFIISLDQASPEVLRVATADKLYNARSVLSAFRKDGETLWRQFNGGRDGTLWYYRAVTNALQENGSGQLVEDLDRAVTELEALAKLTG